MQFKCVTNGQSQAMVMPYVNKDIMHVHLKQISMNTAEDRHAVIIMDGAGWHTEDLAININNVSIIKLPPYSPELNPIEQEWSWLRQHHLANRCFNGYESIVDAVCDAWKTLSVIVKES
ncbi:transposase [Psychromonas arctica]|uniref:transposase n=1 Tax=Psychromonas arctica TaxID=168275 RepID=UPI0006854493|nr:transposase [Psychromonas arctica]